MNRTEEEILKRIEERSGDDLFGFETGHYIVSLSYKTAKENDFVKEGVSEKEWLVEEEPMNLIKQYMEFAWEKANNCRGLSANRSIMHMIAWLWLANHECWEEVQRQYEEEYQYYGKDILVYICKQLDMIDALKYDDGIRSNSEY